MGTFDLRPLSLGEILDRTFTLYRGYFALFLGISAIPHILVLALNLSQLLVVSPMMHPLGRVSSGGTAPGDLVGTLALTGLLSLVSLVVTLLALLLSQGATVLAVSEIYLGRQITIMDSFRRIRGDLGTLLGVLILTFLAVMAGFIFLIIPAIYIGCRLMVSAPAAVIENIGPRDALERSWTLVTDNVGRAFLILLLSWALTIAASLILAWPFQMLAIFSKDNPSMMLVWTGLAQTGAVIAGVLVTPITTIASSVFYYDLRIKKEAFDLQVLVNALGAPVIGASVPTVLG